MFASTGALMRVGWKARKALPLLIALLPFLLSYGTAASNKAVLATPGQLAAYIAENQGNPLLGFIAADTLEAATVWRVRVSAAVILAVLNIALAVGGTRKEEDLGRTELVRAGAVGPLAPLAAVLATALCVNLVGGFSMAAGFLAAGFPAAGSLAAGFATALCGLGFAALSALAAQFASDARLAYGLSFGAVGLGMLMLTLANATGVAALGLFTPLGWCALARPFAGENPWLFVFAVAAVAFLAAAACKLCVRRDVGAGLVRGRGGRSTAHISLCGPIALALRLQRGMALAWIAAYALMGLVIGALAPSIGAMLDGTGFLPELSQAVGGAGKAFLAILSYILAQVLTAYAIMAVLRLREEESLGRTEMMLSRPVSRARLMAGHLIVAHGGSAVALALFGLMSGDAGAAMLRLPAIWVVASASVFLYGVAPRAAAPASWGLFGALLLLEFLWEIRAIGSEIFMLSPFAWVYPGAPMSALALGIILAMGAALAYVGIAAFSRRDLTA